MPQSISSDITRVCKGCGKLFHPHARKQFYCGEDREFTCAHCGKVFIAKCSSYVRSTCSVECSAAIIKQRRKDSAQLSTKVCKWCGKEFQPESVRDAYCKADHCQVCKICGKKFKIDVRRFIPDTCSKECRYHLQMQHRDLEREAQKYKQSLLDKYGVDNPMKIAESKDKIKQTNLDRYGCEWYTQSDQYKTQVEATCKEKYGVPHHLMSSDVINKRKQTVLEKYGADNIFSSEYGKQRCQETMVDRYKVVNPSQYPEFKRKATANSKHSKLELRVRDLLHNYNIEFQHHYILKGDNLSHEFDFYLPKYKLLLDVDGVYFHSYLSDPDGKQVNDYYDDIRVSLVPEDYMFFLIVEENEDRQMKQVVKILESIDAGIFDYDSYLFNWCRSIGFPYPKFTDKRMMQDYVNLCKYQNNKYVPQCRIGESIIKHYHRSIYFARVGSNPSPRDAWYDDKMLKEVIKNRLIYVNDVDPSKVLRGFNVSKTCPVVSIFNPILTKYLVQKYLSAYSQVFDPFSGYSGRLLGVSSTGKEYVGQDLNIVAVNESNKIIQLLNLCDAKVSHIDILQDTASLYECLLTCPPYGDKEHYAKEVETKSCDEWIEYILDKYECKRYVFVVDTTSKYEGNITEEIRSTSHFSNVREKVVVIDR